MFITLLCISSLIALSSSSGSIVPLYIWPQVINGVHNWQPLIDAKRNNPSVEAWAIINPSSGPGTQKDSSYANAINLLKTGNVSVLAYVATTYAAKSINSVKSEIDTYKNWYSIDGIFFDEMAYDASTQHVNYYKNASAYAKSKGLSKTVGNPGTETNVIYVGSVDTIVIYESNGFPNQTQYGGWHKTYSISNWAILPYNIQTLNQTKVNDAKNFVKYIYVTNDNLPNPWDTLPSYLNQLFSWLA